MVVAPGIRAVTRTADGTVRSARFVLEIPRDLLYFSGHFPERKLLPGVVQVAWALELARQHLEVVGTCRSVSDIKFMRVIEPGDSLTLLLTFDADKNRLEFEYHRDDQSCSKGAAQFS